MPRYPSSRLTRNNFLFSLLLFMIFGVQRLEPSLKMPFFQHLSALMGPLLLYVFFKVLYALFKGHLISLCRMIFVECLTNLNFPLLTSNQNKGSPKQPISMKHGSKFLGILLKFLAKGNKSAFRISS